MSEHDKLNSWIALNVTKTLRKLTDAEYADTVKRCDEANSEPHPNLMLTQPSRFDGYVPKYSTDSTAALSLLAFCMKHLHRLTGSSEFQIVVLYDDDSVEPYCVTTDSLHSRDDMDHAKNCASANTMELAICRFAKNLHTTKKPLDN